MKAQLKELQEKQEALTKKLRQTKRKNRRLQKKLIRDEIPITVYRQVQQSPPRVSEIDLSPLSSSHFTATYSFSDQGNTYYMKPDWVIPDSERDYGYSHSSMSTSTSPTSDPSQEEDKEGEVVDSFFY